MTNLRKAAQDAPDAGEAKWLDSPFNACQHRDQCRDRIRSLGHQRDALAAPAPDAGEATWDGEGCFGCWSLARRIAGLAAERDALREERNALVSERVEYMRLGEQETEVMHEALADNEALRTRLAAMEAALKEAVDFVAPTAGEDASFRPMLKRWRSALALGREPK